MKKLQTEQDFITQAEESKKISGEFLFLNEGEALMDRDFKGILMKDLVLQGGDFCSSSFFKCQFENVEFKDTALPGVTFIECKFKNCQFRNTDPSFTLTNCTVESLSVTTIHEPSEVTP